AQAQCRRDPGHGPGQLHRDARPGGRCRLPAPARARTRAAAAAPAALRAALHDGHVHAHPLRTGTGAQPGPARDPGGGHHRPPRPGRHRLGYAGPYHRAAVAGTGTGPLGPPSTMADTFLFYDLETFGADPRRSRIAQFAALRTDPELNPVEAPVSLFVQPAQDLLPSPQATLITGITPQHALREGVREAEAAARIVEEMARPGTCTLGYNSLRFDDEFVRHTLFRNFFDPYEREWRGGNSRWDLLDVLRLAHALRPEGI